MFFSQKKESTIVFCTLFFHTRFILSFQANHPAIGITIEQARQHAIRFVNTELVKANWEIGRHIVEYEQHGKERAEYGSDLLSRLSKDLKQRYGKGYGRQYRISIRNRHFYIDLVFYHRILKCFVLIDLKIKQVEHNDIGQMNLYLNYFRTAENVEDDNEPIGIILSAGKDEVLVEYATGGISNKIFVSQYQLYLPDKKVLQNKVKELLRKNL